MKTKLLRRLRKRAKMDIGIIARVFSYKEIEYSVGARLDIWRGNFHHLDHYYYRYQAEEHLLFRRRQHILSLVKDLRQAKARKQVKKLNQELKRL